MDNWLVSRTDDPQFLVFSDGRGHPLCLTGCRISYDFVPDRRHATAASERGIRLRIVDELRGVVESPRGHTNGVANVVARFPDGDSIALSMQIRP